MKRNVLLILSALLVLFETVIITGCASSSGDEALTKEKEKVLHWTQKANMLFPMEAGGAAYISGKIYHFGGNNGYGGFSNSSYEYNPTTNSWTKKASMSAARINMAVATTDDKVFVIGGDSFQNANEMYDPSIDTWETRAPMLTRRQHVKGVLVKGKIYIIGGLEDWSTVSDKNEVYNIKADSWKQAAPIPTPKHNYSAAVIGHKIYIIGGSTNKDGNIWADTDTIECYDTKKDSWETVFTMPSTRFNPGIAVIDARICLIGGFIDGVVSDRVHVYDTEKNGYYETTPLPVRNVAMGSCTDGNSIFIIGGTEGPDADWKAYNTLYMGTFE